MQNLEIGGVSIAVAEKNIKNMYLRVYPPNGMVRMTVPYRTSEAVIRAFAASRLTWIVEQQQKLRERAENTAQHCRTGDEIRLFGITYRLEWEAAPGRGQVFLRGGCIVLQAPATADEKRRRTLLEHYYRDRLAQEIERRMPLREAGLGVSASSWYLRDMSTRWGTCNTRTGRICLNLRLIHYPPECLDYVITHELCHLTEPNHGKRFYALLETHFPLWRQVRRALETSL